MLNITGNLTVTQGSTGSYAGLLGGQGTFTKTGTSSLTLSNSVNFFGSVAINAGSLIMGSNSNFYKTVTLADTSGAVLNIGSTTLSVRGLVGGGSSGGNVTGNGRLNIVLTGSADSIDVTFSGALSGGGTLNKSGSGTQTIGSDEVDDGTADFSSF
jgi:autotransporter-associated beta strand protein